MKRFFLIFLALFFSINTYAEVNSFAQAKKLLKEHVYYDTMNEGTLYCGCNWSWVGATGGRVDLASCGYEIRKNKVRAERTEWEHVVSAWVLGHQRQCWQNGGRKNCVGTDAVFRKMEADPHNLHIVIGEVNADRSNFSFGVLPQTQKQHGQCDVKIDFKQRTVEPRDEVKGQIARIYFYMHDRYGLNMSRQQQQLFMAWDKMFPVTKAELKRDKRITKIAGNSNPFVTGKAKWELGHKPSRSGLTDSESIKDVADKTKQPANLKIKGNKNSKIYHFSNCSSYAQVSDKNAVFFKSENEAIKAGFRKAKNCK